MNKNMKKINVALLALVVLIGVVCAAYIVWQLTTTITVLEPFEVVSDLPESASLSPGTWQYTINVTNYGGELLNATLYYSISTTNCTVTIAPASGTSYTIQPFGTVTIPVEIEVFIDSYPANGTAIINWWVERSSA